MVRKAGKEDAGAVAGLACLLWPEHEPEEMRREYEKLLEERECAVFLREEGEAVAFAQAQLHHDYVEGTETSPVGYLEGIYVGEAYRGRGIAAELLRACEAWAAERGCTEFASDCELKNAASIAFHKSLGFTEANRIVCLTKKL